MMMLKELQTKEEMLQNFDLLKEVYPSLTLEEYTAELEEMLPHNYGQVGYFENEICIGITGYWMGTKLWCGKYMELDNVVVAENHQGKGIGQQLFAYMEDKAKENDCHMLALDSYSDNFKAHKFFYQQGYIPRGFHFINIIKKDGIR